MGSPSGAARESGIGQSAPAEVRGRAQLGALAVVAARGAPPVPASARLLDAPTPLVGLLPEGGLRRGSTVSVGAAAAASGAGSVSLALSLLAPASAAGAWCAGVGLPDLGLVAAEEAGVVLERLALVPQPGDQWAVVVAALLESLDIVVLRPPARVRAGDARRLMARARERGALLMVLDGPGAAGAGRVGTGLAGRWPEGPDVRLEVTASTWFGLGAGHGHLQGREVEVTVSGRRGADRARSARLQLPAPAAPAAPAAAGAPAACAPTAPSAGERHAEEPGPGPAPAARAG